MVGSAIPGLVVLDALRKQAEQARGKCCGIFCHTVNPEFVFALIK